MNTIVELMRAKPIVESANLVRAARQKLGVSQQEFGNIIGKSQAVISKYEAGIVQPPGDAIMHCMNILKPRMAMTFVQESDPRWAAVAHAMAQLDAALDAIHRP